MSAETSLNPGSARVSRAVSDFPPDASGRSGSPPFLTSATTRNSLRHRDGAEYTRETRAPHIVGLLVLAMFFVCVGIDAQESTPLVRFAALDVFVDSRDVPLAAYQVDLKSDGGDVGIAGIEGGEAPAFRRPPHYDPTAMKRNHVIIADFSMRPMSELPRGRIQVARIHLQVTGAEPPAFQARLVVAAEPDGKAIEADVSTEFLNP